MTSGHPLLRLKVFMVGLQQDSSTVRLHGVAQGVLLYRWWGAVWLRISTNYLQVAVSFALEGTGGEAIGTQ